jgi:hypothetical protein
MFSLKYECIAEMKYVLLRVEICATKSGFSGHTDKDMVHLNKDSGNKSFVLVYDTQMIRIPTDSI